eukprot:11172297-Lingulodinium_polyedra.AAC.1
MNNNGKEQCKATFCSVFLLQTLVFIAHSDPIQPGAGLGAEAWVGCPPPCRIHNLEETLKLEGERVVSSS